MTDVLKWNMMSKEAKVPHDAKVTPKTNIDARGAKITINQRVENTNPAALARASLIDGFVGVTNKIIQPRHRPGSVRLGNGSG